MWNPSVQLSSYCVRSGSSRWQSQPRPRWRPAGRHLGVDRDTAAESSRPRIHCGRAPCHWGLLAPVAEFGHDRAVKAMRYLLGVLIFGSLVGCGSSASQDRAAELADAKCMWPLAQGLGVPYTSQVQTSSVEVQALGHGHLQVTGKAQVLDGTPLSYACDVVPDPSDKLRGFRVTRLRIVPLAAPSDSSGPFKTVPATRGVNFNTAMRRLRAAGFTFINVAETGTGATPGTVTGQYPGAGSNWSTSSSINLTVVPTK